MELKTIDHPEANGRQARYGDTAWVVTMRLEDGTDLIVRMGKQGRDILFGMLMADCHAAGEPEPSQQVQ